MYDVPGTWYVLSYLSLQYKRMNPCLVELPADLRKNKIGDWDDRFLSVFEFVLQGITQKYDKCINQLFKTHSWRTAAVL